MLLATSVAAAETCGDPSTPISDIQGRSEQSRYVGDTVTVEAILTRDARGKGEFRGFYLQQADHQTDADPNTSEALFVYTKRQQGRSGERLRVQGKVKEFHGLTELTNITSIEVCGEEALPEAIHLSLPWPRNPESYENMRVIFNHPLTVVDSYNLTRYGELTLAASDLVNPNEYRTPGTTTSTANLVLLDDGRSEQNPSPTPWPVGGLGRDNSIRAGSSVHQLQGVLDYRFDAWRIQPTQAPGFRATNPRRPAPARPAAEHLRVVTLNLGNLFNGDFPTSRGARTAEGYQAQQQRLVDALLAPDPDILAVAELENDGYGENSAARALAEALGQQWRMIATPGKDGNDEIRTAIFYRNDRAVPAGKAERLTRGAFSTRGRPPIAQTFRKPGGKASIRVVAAHLKSKSCRGASGADEDRGEGCYAKRRTREARGIAQWLESLAHDSDLAGTLITGDLNSYARETPIATLEQAGYTSMMHRFHPCSADHCPHYTYRYKGQKGTLDYALASQTLIPRVLDAQSWLINADEPRGLGYRDTPATHQPSPWRSSDHNPVIIDIAL
ncbi:ExeM/NucH family extracellular endonuclease [Marinobacter salinexigens]|uniref:ExeM/NucH family extracellular endonuclease n=1 Tax=Marinobacter salinexigens TaxID=2919747 RepID=A0A5B0VIM4_9GAMM|nr:ExeM/NucH family extracellular endonuclease [Marinobacter salinexigens]